MKFASQFAPWIVFALLSDTDWRLALVTGLVLQIVTVLVSRPHHVGVLDGAMIVFFTVIGVIAVVAPDSPIKEHVDVMSSAWLALVAGGSILIGRPFTLDFSRDAVPPEVAASPRFMSSNKKISAVWAAAFAGMAATGVVGEALGAPRLHTIATLALLFGAMKFTMSYPAHAAQRASSHAAGRLA